MIKKSEYNKIKTIKQNKTESHSIHIRISSIAAIISVACAFGSRRVAITANRISENMLFATEQSNMVAQRTLEIEENRKLNENKEKSVRILGDLYDKIMYTPGLYDVYTKITKKTLEGNEEYLRRFVDELEGLGYEYCQEQVYKSDLRLYRGFLLDICNNSVIVNNFKGYKNGLSKLCLDICGTTGMGNYYNGGEECRILE